MYLLLRSSKASLLAYQQMNQQILEFICSLLNVIASIHGKPYLIGGGHMEACNHCSFSQAIIRSVTDIDIEFSHITAVVSDSAAYCRKAYREVLSAVVPNSVHVLCLAHIVNLVAQVFRHHYEFMHHVIFLQRSSLPFSRSQEGSPVFKVSFRFYLQH